MSDDSITPEQHEANLRWLAQAICDYWTHPPKEIGVKAAPRGLTAQGMSSVHPHQRDESGANRVLQDWEE